MDPLSLTFVFSAFLAGIITFLAPCTLPLVPGYLSFISGASIADLQNPQKAAKVRLKIFLNGFFYVLGFSAVFILFFGVLIGLAGSIFGQYRLLLTKTGGVFVIFFGLFLLAQAVTALTQRRFNLLAFPAFAWVQRERHISSTRHVKPGNPTSSFLLGASFAFGWTPCVGPILAVILGLTIATATFWQSIFLLAVFAFGLALPFLLTALAIGWAAAAFQHIAAYLYWVSLAGGIFLVLLGYLMITGDFMVLNSLIFRFLGSIGFSMYEEFLIDLL